MKNFIKSNAPILAVVVLLIAAMISSAAIYHLRIKQYSTWLPTEGIIQQVEPLRRHKTRYHYSYFVDGEEHKGSEIFRSRSTEQIPEPGDSAEIWYDPARPDNSLYGRAEPGLDPYAPLLMAMPLSVAVYYSLSRNRSLSVGVQR